MLTVAFSETSYVSLSHSASICVREADVSKLTKAMIETIRIKEEINIFLLFVLGSSFFRAK